MVKVLVITYYWPPSGGSGVQRWLYFCKYLSDFGFEPVVLTVDPEKASYKYIDENLLDEVASIETYRTNTWELLKTYSLLTTGNRKKGIPHGDVNKNKKGLLYKVSAYVRGNFFIPDARKGWNKFAIKKAREIIKHNDIPVVITTGPPHSTHFIGNELKKELDVRWLADFRDPWTDLYYNKDLMRTKRSNAKDAAMEIQILKNADTVLTIGEKLKELLRSKVSGPHEKFYHIFNGYDARKMSPLKAERHNHFEMTFIGVLSPNQSYRALLESIKLFLTKNDSADVKLCFAGNTHNEVQRAFEEELSGVPMQFHGYVSHEKSLQFMKNSQLLLNCLAEMEHSEILISGKQMEYLATGNPILCFGNEKGESAILFKDFSNAEIFEKNRVHDAYEFIQLVYDRWKQGTPFVNEIDDERILAKSRKETTRELSQLLEKLIN